jgi:hypothetical protein
VLSQWLLIFRGLPDIQEWGILFERHKIHPIGTLRRQKKSQIMSLLFFSQSVINTTPKIMIAAPIDRSFKPFS